MPPIFLVQHLAVYNSQIYINTDTQYPIKRKRAGSYTVEQKTAYFLLPLYRAPDNQLQFHALLTPTCNTRTCKSTVGRGTLRLCSQFDSAFIETGPNLETIRVWGHPHSLADTLCAEDAPHADSSSQRHVTELGRVTALCCCEEHEK